MAASFPATCFDPRATLERVTVIQAGFVFCAAKPRVGRFPPDHPGAIFSVTRLQASGLILREAMVSGRTMSSRTQTQMTVSASTVALAVSLYTLATSGCTGTSPQTAEALRDAIRRSATPIVEELVRQAIPLPKDKTKPDAE